MVPNEKVQLKSKCNQLQMQLKLISTVTLLTFFGRAYWQLGDTGTRCMHHCCHCHHTWVADVL